MNGLPADCALRGEKLREQGRKPAEAEHERHLLSVRLVTDPAEKWHAPLRHTGRSAPATFPISSAQTNADSSLTGGPFVLVLLYG